MTRPVRTSPPAPTPGPYASAAPGATDSAGEPITGLLESARAGDAAAFDRAFGLVYRQLRQAAHRQLRGIGGEGLCTTALVSESWLKLSRASIDAHDRGHFLAIAARAMRMIVVDEARRVHAEKRGGRMVRITLGASLAGEAHGSGELLALDAALQRLASVEPRLARVVEWRYFGGLSEREVAAQLGLTVRTVRRDWRKARAFLYRDMMRGESRP